MSERLCDKCGGWKELHKECDLTTIRTFVERVNKRFREKPTIALFAAMYETLAAMEKQKEWEDTREERVETVEKLVEEAVRIIREHE